MRALANGESGDVPVVSGESGAVGLAGLMALIADADAAKQAGLDAQARVLLLSTEGATAPAVYRELTGQTADDVRAAQRRWTMSG
jgi:threonine dehydratase